MELGLYIILSIQKCASTFSNFFIEVKGPDGSGVVAKHEVCYDGVVDVSAIHVLRSFGVKDPKTVYNNNAYIITLVYHSATGTLQLFTTHSIFLAESPKYYMNQVRSFTMTDTVKAFW